MRSVRPSYMSGFFLTIPGFQISNLSNFLHHFGGFIYFVILKIFRGPAQNVSVAVLAFVSEGILNFLKVLLDGMK